LDWRTDILVIKKAVENIKENFNGKIQMMNTISGRFMVSVNKISLLTLQYAFEEVWVSSVCCCLFSKLFVTDSKYIF